MSCKLKYPGPVTGSLRITFPDTTTRPTLPLLYHILKRMSSINWYDSDSHEMLNIFLGHSEIVRLRA